MTRHFPILFDLPPRIDRVTMAIVPTDAFTGAIVAAGVRASVKGLPGRPIRNGSGMLVFVNLPDQPSYEVEVDGRDAGYFGPDTILFEPPAAPDPSGRSRRVELMMKPRPDFPFAPATTLVRGVVVDGDRPAADASVWAEPAANGGRFETRATERGAFALALRLPPIGPFEEEAEVEVVIHFEQGFDHRELACRLVNGRSHSFAEPIDLAGANEPEFFQGG